MLLSEQEYNEISSQLTGKMAAVVMDSFDYEAALERITTGNLKNKVLEKKGTIILRPDSGVPVDVVMKALNIIAKNVGYKYNSKGYKVLHPCYRIIQGDGVNVNEIGRILSWMEANRWSAENIAFGMGGGLLQQLDRDTQRFAMKCCSAIVQGVERDVFKAPKTDMNKASKKGYLDTVLVDGQLETVATGEFGKVLDNTAMSVIFENGVVFRDNLPGIEEIRETSNQYALAA